MYGSPVSQELCFHVGIQGRWLITLCAKIKVINSKIKYFSISTLKYPELSVNHESLNLNLADEKLSIGLSNITI